MNIILIYVFTMSVARGQRLSFTSCVFLTEMLNNLLLG